MKFVITVQQGERYGYLNNDMKVEYDYRKAKTFDSVEDAETFIKEHKVDWKCVIRIEIAEPF